MATALTHPVWSESLRVGSKEGVKGSQEMTSLAALPQKILLLRGVLEPGFWFEIDRASAAGREGAMEKMGPPGAGIFWNSTVKVGGG